MDKERKIYTLPDLDPNLENCYFGKGYQRGQRVVYQIVEYKLLLSPDGTIFHLDPEEKGELVVSPNCIWINPK